ncbi:hypothetical protein C4D60_Mb04t07450 [Musa balbisiana]|uniref:DUF3700 domain-containing protein n=1 Tax=Musa balbisiana TaxID=52838 RepID=A0A4S8KAB7_MUSBA|nr:hypothetical protein C4D60_Mb04t07450 [Musa balbisiana]
MLAVFDRTVAKIPEGLRAPAAELGEGGGRLMGHFSATRDGAVVVNLGSGGAMAYTPEKHNPFFPRFLAVVDNVFCLFQGHVENIASLKQLYGLGKTTNEAIIVIEAYKTLRDRGPFPASQVVRDLRGHFAFVLFDISSNSTFIAADADGRVPFFWGADSEGHLVLSDDVDIVKKGCGRSFAPFPRGCFFTTSGGLQSFQHPLNELKAIPRVDSQGQALLEGQCVLERGPIGPRKGQCIKPFVIDISGGTVGQSGWTKTMLSSPSTPARPPLLSPPPPPLPLPKFHHHLLLPVRRRRLLASLTAPLLQLLLVSPSPARARGLFRMPPARLANRYFLVRAGESVYESAGVLRTNPVAKTSVDSGLSPEGARQAARAALELKRMGACEDSCWIWPSITQRSYQAAEIIASVNSIDRSRIVPEYSFLDARGLGAFEGRNIRSISEVYESDSLSPDNKPPPVDDGTPNESVADVFVRVTQLMSILETQYSGDTVIIVSPDSDNLSVLQAGLVGLDLRRHSDLLFSPGEVRLVDPSSIPDYKQPASAVYKCANPPSCK